MFSRKVAEAIREAETSGLLGETQQGVLTGFSGKKLIGTLQRLAALLAREAHGGNTCYLEVGVFQGLTLLSVAREASGMPCYGIDNFAYFDPEGKNQAIVEARRSTLDLNNVFLINMDYEDAMERLDQQIGGKQVGLFFVDGPHDYRSQLMCLELAVPYLHPEAVIVVDDSNYRHVRQANRDFLVTHPEFKLLFEAYTRCHPANMSSEEHAEAREGWWNGVNILVRDPSNRIQPMFPPTLRRRDLYENEHITHSSPVSHLLPQAVRLLQALDDNSVPALFRQLVSLRKSLRESKVQRKALFPSMNTFSDDLPGSHFNESI